MTDDVQRFKLGDTVTWESASNGSVARKTGTVVGIIPPNMHPTGRAVAGVLWFSDAVAATVKQTITGAVRLSWSYIVHVPAPSPTRSCTYYWPIARKLERAGRRRPGKITKRERPQMHNLRRSR